MSRPRSAALVLGAGLALALPASTNATQAEIGTNAGEAKASCPDRPCLAISRTTGFQAKVGTNRGLMTVPSDGRLVSWSITLAKPTDKQVDFFDKELGGASEAAITVLQPRGKLRYRVVSAGEPQKLERYFGQTVEFALQRTLRVRKGWTIGLKVPTWAPALAVNLPGDTSWRASRAKGTCDDSKTQTAARSGSTPQFYCLYRTARLTYSARFIPDPQPTAQD
ncbi:MAG TPA: hypothetical protein VD931_18345 [Baekduia sp.]|nr:hypothetical protein [Baekduia sp.]